MTPVITTGIVLIILILLYPRLWRFVKTHDEDDTDLK